jgi:hypothetical protein
MFAPADYLAESGARSFESDALDSVRGQRTPWKSPPLCNAGARSSYFVDVYGPPFTSTLNALVLVHGQA